MCDLIIFLRRKKSFIYFFLTCFLLTSANGLYAADTVKGEGIAKRICAACHGKKGISRSPVFPNLSGQKEAYILKQLKDFKSGFRSSNNMQGVAKNLSEQDMMDVAAFYSSYGIIAETANKVSKSLVKKVEKKLNICIPCHTKSGISIDSKYPNLAGQKARYLQKELEKFQKGQRKDTVMSAIVAQLNKKDFKNLSQYFSKAGKVKIQGTEQIE